MTEWIVKASCAVADCVDTGTGSNDPAPWLWIPLVIVGLAVLIGIIYFGRRTR